MSRVPLDVLRLGTDIRRQFDPDLFTKNGYAIKQQSDSLQAPASSVQWALVVMQDNHNPISIQRTIRIGGLAINNSMVSRLYTLLRIQPAKLPDGTDFYGLNFHPKREDISTSVNFDVVEAALNDFQTNSFGANEDDQKPEHDPIRLREKLKRHLDGQHSGLKNLMPTMDELRPIDGYKSGFLEGSEAPFDADKIKTGASLRKDFCPSPHRRGITSRMVNLFYGLFVDMRESLVVAGASPDNLPDMICPLDTEFVLLNTKFLALLDQVDSGKIFTGMTEAQIEEASDLVKDLRKYGPFVRRSLLSVAFFHAEIHIQEAVMLNPLNYLNVFSALLLRIGYRSKDTKIEQAKVARDVANLLRTPQGERYYKSKSNYLQMLARLKRKLQGTDLDHELEQTHEEETAIDNNRESNEEKTDTFADHDGQNPEQAFIQQVVGEFLDNQEQEAALEKERRLYSETSVALRCEYTAETLSDMNEKELLDSLRQNHGWGWIKLPTGRVEHEGGHFQYFVECNDVIARGGPNCKPLDPRSRKLVHSVDYFKFVGEIRNWLLGKHIDSTDYAARTQFLYGSPSLPQSFQGRCTRAAMKEEAERLKHEAEEAKRKFEEAKRKAEEEREEKERKERQQAEEAAKKAADMEKRRENAAALDAELEAKADTQSIKTITREMCCARKQKFCTCKNGCRLGRCYCSQTVTKERNGKGKGLPEICNPWPGPGEMPDNWVTEQNGCTCNIATCENQFNSTKRLLKHKKAGRKPSTGRLEILMLLLAYVYSSHREELNKIWFIQGNKYREKIKKGIGGKLAERRYVDSWWSSENPTEQIQMKKDGEFLMWIVDNRKLYKDVEGKPILEEGLHIDRLGNGLAKSAGFKVGDRIVSIQVNSDPRIFLNYTEKFVDCLKNVEKGAKLQFNIERQDHWPIDEEGAPKSVIDRVKETLKTQKSESGGLPRASATVPDGLDLPHIDNDPPSPDQQEAAKEEWDLKRCILEIKNLHPGAISLHRFLEYDLWIATQPFIDSVVEGKSRTMYEHLVPIAVYLANSQPKVCRAMLQHVSDREHLIKFRPEVLTSIGQNPGKQNDITIEHHNGQHASTCNRMGTGKNGHLTADVTHYIIASASSPGLVSLEEELLDFFLGKTSVERKSERVRTHRRIKGDYFKDVRAVMLNFLESLILSACNGDLDKTWPPIDPFTTGKEAALRELSAWKNMQDEHVKNQFSKMVARRSAEVENQKRAKKDAQDIITNHKSKSDADEHVIDLTEHKEIHSKEIREMNDTVANARLPGDDKEIVTSMPRAKKSKGKRGAGGSLHNSKVFKITVLGRAEAGKSSLCMRMIANSTLRTYEHTTTLQLYHREMDTRKLRQKMSISGGGGGKKHSHSSGRGGGRDLIAYGLQIEDVPGEVSGAVEDGTIEKDTILRKNPSASGYSQLLHDNTTWLDIPPNEKTALLGGEKKRMPAIAEKHVNLLYIPMKTDGFIVMFDVQSGDSLSKARAIIKSIRKGPNSGAPIMLLGNKTDVGHAGAEVKRKAADFVAHSGGGRKRGARANGKKEGVIMYAQGSVAINSFQFQGEDMDCYNLINAFVQNLNSLGAGVESSEYESRFLNTKRGRGRDRGGTKSAVGASGVDASGESMSAWGCCNCFANSNPAAGESGRKNVKVDRDGHANESMCIVS
eukprot:g4665.t1